MGHKWMALRSKESLCHSQPIRKRIVVGRTVLSKIVPTSSSQALSLAPSEHQSHLSPREGALFRLIALKLSCKIGASRHELHSHLPDRGTSQRVRLIFLVSTGRLEEGIRSHPPSPSVTSTLVCRSYTSHVKVSTGRNALVLVDGTL